MPPPLRREAARTFAPAPRCVAQGPIALAAAPDPDLPAGSQLRLFEGEDHNLPCNVQVEVNYALRTAIVRRQSDEGGMWVLAHIGGGVLQPLKRWRTHLEPSERKQIVTRLEATIGAVKVLR